MQKITTSQWEFLKPARSSNSRHPTAYFRCKLCNKIYKRQRYPIEKGISKCCANCSREANNACRWKIEFYGRGRKPIIIYNLAKWAKQEGYPAKELENKAQGRIVRDTYGIKRITKLLN